MRRTISLTKVTGMIMAGVIAISGFAFPSQVHAASKNNNGTSYKTLTTTDLEINKRKVGGRYFSYDGDNFLSQTSLKKDAVAFTEDPTATLISTNGNYAYYQTGEEEIVKTDISSKKTSVVIDDTDGEITHVYSSSVFYQEDEDDGTTAIYCYNTKKNKTKTISDDAEDTTICAAGRYLVFGEVANQTLKIRDCKKGKTTVITKKDASYPKTDGKKVIYLAYNEETGLNELTSYNISKKKNTVLTTIENYESAAVSYDLKEFAYESSGKYYLYNISDRTTEEISAKEYQKY